MTIAKAAAIRAALVRDSVNPKIPEERREKAIRLAEIIHAKIQERTRCTS